jgi:hypothetical protein
MLLSINTNIKIRQNLIKIIKKWLIIINKKYRREKRKCRENILRKSKINLNLKYSSIENQHLRYSWIKDQGTYR